jgi:nicotinamidase-related amidase
MPDYAIDGTDGHGFVPGFEPLESETVVRKHRSSAFTGTPLAAMLASRGVRTVVCTGVTTQGCVESTARDALLLDFHPVVVADAVASTDLATHEASLLVQNARYDVVDGATVLEIWQRATGTTGGPRATEAAV